MATKTVRAPMPRSRRAKQFMPFDALCGLKEAIAAKERVIEPRRYPSDDAIAEIERLLIAGKTPHLIQECIQAANSLRLKLGEREVSVQLLGGGILKDL